MIITINTITNTMSSIITNTSNADANTNTNTNKHRGQGEKGEKKEKATSRKVMHSSANSAKRRSRLRVPRVHLGDRRCVSAGSSGLEAMSRPKR